MGDRPKFRLTGATITRSNVRLFQPEAVDHETHVPAFRRQAQAHAWFSCPDEDRRRPQGALRAARQGPQAARTLTNRVAAARPKGARRYRLSGAGEFDALFRRARRVEGRFLQLLWSEAAREPGRAGFAIPAKALPRAVDRNRLRRMLREAVRAARPSIESMDVILRLRRSAPRAEFASIVREAAQMLANLLATTKPQ
jgi:ribonuclease P protein component